MINKRLLVKNLLAHNDENSFYDKKRSINIGQKEGKAKFLKPRLRTSQQQSEKQFFHSSGRRRRGQ